MWPFTSGSGDIPDVIVDFVFSQGLLFITLDNIGDAPAYNVSITFDKEIRGVSGSKSISEMSLFRRVEFMPPKKMITTFLDTSASYYGRGEPLEIETNIVFHNRRGKRYNNKIRHNLDIYRDIGYVQSQWRVPESEHL